MFMHVVVYNRNTTVDLSHIETPPNMTHWPIFHNGVAAGLRIANTTQVRVSSVHGIINTPEFINTEWFC